jgi:hypothetical protein
LGDEAPTYPDEWYRAAVANLLVAAPSVEVVLSGAGLTAAVIALLTPLQRQSPGELQGRVYAAFEVATTVPQTVSIGLGAYLVTTLDYRLVLGIESVVMLVAALLMFRASSRSPATVQPAAVALLPVEAK